MSKSVAKAGVPSAGAAQGSNSRQNRDLGNTGILLRVYTVQSDMIAKVYQCSYLACDTPKTIW